METEIRRIPMQRIVEATLAGLGAGPSTRDPDPANTLFALQCVGDALRAGVGFSREIRTWLRTVGDDALCGAVDLLAHEVQGWTGDDRDASLAFALRRRDEAASVLDALAWRFARTPPLPTLTAALADLDARLARYDRSVSIDRAAAESLLELRADLAAADWLRSLHDDRAAATDDAARAQPDDATLHAWLRHGTLHRFVEGCATRDPAFAEHLRDLVDGALDEVRHDPSLAVSFVARRWRQRAAGQTRIDLSVGPRRLAAMTENLPVTTVEHRLGDLHPLRATARVDVADGIATLSVFAEPGVVTRVRWGEVTAAPGPTGICRVERVFDGGDPRVVVSGRDGAEVAFELALTRDAEP